MRPWLDSFAQPLATTLMLRRARQHPSRSMAAGSWLSTRVLWHGRVRGHASRRAFGAPQHEGLSRLVNMMRMTRCTAPFIVMSLLLAAGPTRAQDPPLEEATL